MGSTVDTFGFQLDSNYFLILLFPLTCVLKPERWSSCSDQQKWWQWSIIRPYRVFIEDMSFSAAWFSLHFSYSPSSSLLYEQWKNLHDAQATTCTLLLIGFKKAKENLYRSFWLCVSSLFWDFPTSTWGNLWYPSFFVFPPPLGGCRWHWVGRNRHLTSDFHMRIPYTESVRFYLL